MQNSKRGEIVTLVALVSFVVISAATIISSTFFSAGKQTIRSNAEEIKCAAGICPVKTVTGPITACGQACSNLNKCDTQGICNPACCSNDGDCDNDQTCGTGVGAYNGACQTNKSCDPNSGTTPTPPPTGSATSTPIPTSGAACNAGDCSSWKCPGNQCEKCGVAPWYWWRSGCPAKPAATGCCTPCGNTALICTSGDPQTKCDSGTSYRQQSCGNDGCYHDTGSSCAAPPTAVPTTKPGSTPQPTVPGGGGNTPTPTPGGGGGSSGKCDTLKCSNSTIKYDLKTDKYTGDFIGNYTSTDQSCTGEMNSSLDDYCSTSDKVAVNGSISISTNLTIGSNDAVEVYAGPCGAANVAAMNLVVPKFGAKDGATWNWTGAVKNKCYAFAAKYYPDWIGSPTVSNVNGGVVAKGKDDNGSEVEENVNLTLTGKPPVEPELFIVTTNVQNNIPEDMRGDLSDLTATLVLDVPGGKTPTSNPSPIEPVANFSTRDEGTFSTSLTFKKSDYGNYRNQRTCYIIFKKANFEVTRSNKFTCQPGDVGNQPQTIQIEYEKGPPPTSDPNAAPTPISATAKQIITHIKYNLFASCARNAIHRTTTLSSVDNPQLKISYSPFQVQREVATDSVWYYADVNVLIDKINDQPLTDDVFTINVQGTFGADPSDLTQFEGRYSGKFNELTSSSEISVVPQADCAKGLELGPVDQSWLNQSPRPPVSVYPYQIVTWTNSFSDDIWVGIYNGPTDNGQLMKNGASNVLHGRNFTFQMTQPGSYLYIVCDVGWAGNCDNGNGKTEGIINVLEVK